MNPQRLKRLKEKTVPSNPMWVGLEYTNSRHVADKDFTDSTDVSFLFNFAAGYLASAKKEYLSAAKTMFRNFPSKYDRAPA